MNAVIELTCCRGLSAAVPVAGSYADRDIGMDHVAFQFGPGQQ